MKVAVNFMKFAKQQVKCIQRFALIGLACSVSVAGIPIAALAQTYVPPDRGLPGRREGGGTRGACVTSQPSLTALIPQTNYGLTTQTAPTLLWYIPTTTATLAEFELRNQQDQVLYTRQIPMTGQTGIIQIHLVSGQLEVGQLYHWNFVLVCDLQDRSGDVMTEGWIERTDPDTALTNQLQRASSEEQALLYAKAGIWYDALSTLADLQTSQPNQPLSPSWIELLTEVSLKVLADKPLIPCCTSFDPRSSGNQ